MVMLGISLVVFTVVYIWKQTNGMNSDADYWTWFANQSLHTFMTIRTLLAVGGLTIVMGLMLLTYRH